ncbi:TetR/AcrR family transcriptional regulator C-terminal domain-containing protein [Cryptosporangium arvum]|uniref:TetR/AcrR family transcriptional regulator C-terminal domain-containing protein n=1 Tax=Cryptosporangium arvum TaxID=80871 RepID=UPI0004B8FEAA|nr:TetR/AcrR family transcriptional regulator C-terminal domain-containing protein [Cryptosporangium arvum]
MLTWSKPTPARAPGLPEVVDAAIVIADAEGLPAVSMRRVATALRSGTASLYRIVESREEIVERMVDAVLGEAIPAPATGDWRADLAALARNRRALLRRHPWLGIELAGRPAIGPNALSHHEHALAAVAGLTEDPTSASSAVETLLAYVLGAVARETAESQRAGLSEPEWRAEVAPYLEQVIDGYPRLRRMMREAEDFGPDDRFERGLTCVLNGIAGQ